MTLTLTLTLTQVMVLGRVLVELEHGRRTDRSAEVMGGVTRKGLLVTGYS